MLLYVKCVRRKPTSALIQSIGERARSDVNAHVQTQTDVARWMQSEVGSVCERMQLQDTSRHYS